MGLHVHSGYRVLITLLLQSDNIAIKHTQHHLRIYLLSMVTDSQMQEASAQGNHFGGHDIFTTIHLHLGKMGIGHIIAFGNRSTMIGIMDGKGRTMQDIPIHTCHYPTGQGT